MPHCRDPEWCYVTDFQRIYESSLNIRNNGRPFKVAMIALLVPWKNHQDFLKLAQSFQERSEDVEFLIAGSGNSDYPDNLDKAINGGLNGVPGTDPKSNGTQQSGLGLYNEVHVELDQDMTELQNDISQITAMLQQNNGVNVDMTKSLEQFQLATAQGVVK